MSQICVVGIYVPELEKAIAFYRDILGFEVEKEYGKTIVSLKHGDLPLILEQSNEAKIKSENGVSGVVLTFSTTDINETLQYLNSKDVDVLSTEPEDCPPGKFIRFKDPFGNILEYLQFV
ncbi:VOC family protein [Chungangia koreensis]|uniref:VOC family protein n=1 Tax=Chungangia koreensis TaxID=752657 RepID=A0ABV8X4Q6_9LACT